MYRQFILISTAIITIMLMTACGGVASNPTSPKFNQGGQAGAQGEQPGAGLPGELSGGGAEMGEEIIHGDYETLWAQGMEAMESSQVVNAAQFFMSAFAQDPDSAEAALAYAITDALRDYRKFAIFLHPGVDRLFLNTPLAGHAEVFPNPFLAEDSYFLRLAALGNNTRKLNPSVMYQIIGPIDTEANFTPEAFTFLLSHQEETQPRGDEPTGDIEVRDEGGMTVTLPPGGEVPVSPTPPPDGGDNEPADDPERMNIAPPKPPAGKQDIGPGTTDTGGSGEDGMHTDPDGKFHGGFTSEMEGGITPPAFLPERENAISEDEWITYINDYRNAATRDGADIFLCVNLYNNLAKFHSEIQEHISNLESVRTYAEEEGFSLMLPFNALDGTQKITLMFDADDYRLVLGYYKMLDVMLSYVECYSTDLEYFLTSSEAEDTDGDMILTPDEYLPPAPFGTLTEEGQEEIGNILSDLVTALTTLTADMDPLFVEANDRQAGDPENKELFFLSTFHRNYVVIEDWNRLLQDIADKSSSGILVKLTSGSGIEEVVVIYDALFISPIEDIRDVLPSYDLTNRIVITDDEGIWSADSTFGGFFQEGLETTGTFETSSRFNAVVYDETMKKAAGYMFNLGATSAEVSEKGVVNISEVTLDELIGTPYTVQNADGEEVGSGAVRTIYEIIPLFDVEKISVMLSPVKDAFETSGMTGIGVPGADEPDTRMEDILPGDEPVDGGGEAGEGDQADEEEEKAEDSDGTDDDSEEDEKKEEPGDDTGRIRE